MGFIKVRRIRKTAQNSNNLRDIIYNGIIKSAEKGHKTYEISNICLGDYFDWEKIKEELIDLEYYVFMHKKSVETEDLVRQDNYQVIITWDEDTYNNLIESEKLLEHAKVENTLKDEKSSEKTKKTVTTKKASK